MPSKTKKESIIHQFKEGISPNNICENLNCSMVAIRRSVNEAIGEGTLRRCDLFFSIPDKVRYQVNDLRKDDANLEKIKKSLKERGLDARYADLLNSLDTKDQFYGDMYEYIRIIEITLHDFIKETLIDEFGSKETNWWRQIKTRIRKSCVTRREEDPDPTDKFNYTNFIDLATILDNNWGIFKKKLPNDIEGSKREFLSQIRKLNQIRNAVMHPVKNREWTTKDLQFAREFHKKAIRISNNK